MKYEFKTARNSLTLTHWITIISLFNFIHPCRNCCVSFTLNFTYFERVITAKSSLWTIRMLQMPTICLYTITSYTRSALWSAATSLTSLKYFVLKMCKLSSRRLKPGVTGSKPRAFEPLFGLCVKDGSRPVRTALMQSIYLPYNQTYVHFLFLLHFFHVLLSAKKNSALLYKWQKTINWKIKLIADKWKMMSAKHIYKATQESQQVYTQKGCWKRFQQDQAGV